MLATAANLFSTWCKWKWCTTLAWNPIESCCKQTRVSFCVVSLIHPNNFSFVCLYIRCVLEALNIHQGPCRSTQTACSPCLPSSVLEEEVACSCWLSSWFWLLIKGSHETLTAPSSDCNCRWTTWSPGWLLSARKVSLGNVWSYWVWC